MHTNVLESSLSLDKAHAEMVDDGPNTITVDEKPVVSKAYDYSGAAGKTDPAEIALVRKLDMRIMPTIWAMYFLNYVSDQPECCVHN